MVYDGCDYEYATQVTAEHKVNVKKNGTVQQVWQLKHSHGDNHFLDTEVYAMAAADVLGVRTLHLQTEDVPKRQNAVPDEAETAEEQWIKVHDDWIQKGGSYGS